MEEACTIERMREDRWASLTECASIQVRKFTGASRISTKVHVCIIPCARRNESEWRRDADRERRQRRCEAQINRRLRTCIRLEERIRILDADFVQFATISSIEEEDETENAIHVNTRENATGNLYVWKDVAKDTLLAEIKTEKLPSR